MKRNLLKKTCIAMAAVCSLSTAMLAGSAHGENTADNSASVAGNDTIYGVGSVSKTYAAVAAMQLADKGLIDIDAPVTDYVPEFEMADPRYKDITVRMLMNHTSGLYGTSTLNWMLVEDNDTESEDVFLDCLKNEHLKAAPGEYAAYCNDGFILLEKVIERVSGMDFTTYLTENIAKPLGCTQTGSNRNMLEDPNFVRIYDKYNRPSHSEYCTLISTGGVVSTAYETALFGGTFFKGDNTLLSENAKNEMAKRDRDDDYESKYGLGWDNVDLYADKGIKVVTKGGDVFSQHASLVVAPDEKISVAVLSSGGSSGIDMLFAESLLDIALKEQGVELKETEKDIPVCDTIPAEYAQYEGIYFAGKMFLMVSFHDMKYIQLDVVNNDNATTEYYKYSADGKFVKMVGDVPNGGGSVDRDTSLISFVDRPDGTVIAQDSVSTAERIGKMDMAEYVAKKYTSVPASDSAKAAWAARSDKYYLAEGKYKNGFFLLASTFTMEPEFSIIDDNCIEAGGTIFGIRDENTLVSINTVPGDKSRDVNDIYVVNDNGREMLVDSQWNAKFIAQKDMPKLTTGMTEVNFKGREVNWFTFDSSLGASMISIERTDETAVCIYDKYDVCIYSTYMSTPETNIPLPSEGKIVFLGEGGESVKVTFN